MKDAEMERAERLLQIDVPTSDRQGAVASLNYVDKKALAETKCISKPVEKGTILNKPSVPTGAFANCKVRLKMASPKRLVCR